MGCKLYWYQKFLLFLSFVNFKSFWTFVQASSLQSFLLMILIYKWGHWVYHNWGKTINYHSLAYPSRISYGLYY